MARAIRRTGMRAAVIAAFALLGAGCGKTSVVPSAIPWTTLERGEELARATGKPAFVFFFATWNTADKELDEVTFSAPSIRAQMQDFIPIRVDTSDDELVGVNQAKDRFGVVGLPTLLVVRSFDDYPGGWRNTSRPELLRVTEFETPEELRPKLAAAKRNYDAFRAERRRAE